jgi:hypothetical protein
LSFSLAGFRAYQRDDLGPGVLQFGSGHLPFALGFAGDPIEALDLVGENRARAIPRYRYFEGERGGSAATKQRAMASTKASPTSSRVTGKVSAGTPARDTATLLR